MAIKNVKTIHIYLLKLFSFTILEKNNFYHTDLQKTLNFFHRKETETFLAIKLRGKDY